MSDPVNTLHEVACANVIIDPHTMDWPAREIVVTSYVNFVIRPVVANPQNRLRFMPIFDYRRASVKPFVQLNLRNAEQRIVGLDQLKKVVMAPAHILVKQRLRDGRPEYPFVELRDPTSVAASGMLYIHQYTRDRKNYACIERDMSLWRLPMEAHNGEGLRLVVIAITNAEHGLVVKSQSHVENLKIVTYTVLHDEPQYLTGHDYRDFVAGLSASAST